MQNFKLPCLLGLMSKKIHQNIYKQITQFPIAGLIEIETWLPHLRRVNNELQRLKNKTRHILKAWGWRAIPRWAYFLRANTQIAWRNFIYYNSRQLSSSLYAWKIRNVRLNKSANCVSGPRIRDNSPQSPWVRYAEELSKIHGGIPVRSARWVYRKALKNPRWYPGSIREFCLRCAAFWNFFSAPFFINRSSPSLKLYQNQIEKKS